ncbi:MAG: hypothetical protein EXR75_00760 [Myxococcales bacterium]|nr:hypothetical protein [Myxococcales bacterium]
MHGDDANRDDIRSGLSGGTCGVICGVICGGRCGGTCGGGCGGGCGGTCGGGCGGVLDHDDVRDRELATERGEEARGDVVVTGCERRVADTSEPLELRVTGG